MNLFITGTDTGVGKTYVTARLIQLLRGQGLDTVGFKPICCGGRRDAELLRAAADDSLELNEVNPVWLRTPAAPYAAAMIENRHVDLALIRETFASIRERHASILVEGVGGWLVPITRDYSVANLAAEFGLPVAVVVKNRLGALNHAALTVQHIRSGAAGELTCAGLILNDGNGAANIEDSNELQEIAMTTNQGILEDWLNVTVLHSFGTNQKMV